MNQVLLVQKQKGVRHATTISSQISVYSVYFILFYSFFRPLLLPGLLERVFPFCLLISGASIHVTTTLGPLGDEAKCDVSSNQSRLFQNIPQNAKMTSPCRLFPPYSAVRVGNIWTVSTLVLSGKLPFS